MVWDFGVLRARLAETSIFVNLAVVQGLEVEDDPTIVRHTRTPTRVVTGSPNP